MDSYHNLKQELLQLNQDIVSLFATAGSIPGMPDHSFEDWEKTCKDTASQIAEEIIRVAVVGPIKSGKSTFVNSLFKGDYLKRGAGVVTSIVTRIRNGDALRAELYFKSWEEVNAEMDQAMVPFRSLNRSSNIDGFDIRQAKDRQALQETLDGLSREHLITNDTRNVNSVLLSSCLKGYETVKEIVSTEMTTRPYEKERFPEHKSFVSDESLAVYLKDVELEIDAGTFDSHIEIADCQGSDSPNPLHLAMIQDYLFLTHFIIYVISSRTGLRQADIKFLSMIAKMGILDNILFVVNCDFSEHESLDDLKSLLKRVKEELSLIKPDPDIYAFSALYNLFRSRKESLSEKERQRLIQWENEEAFAAFSHQETERFELSFNQKLTRERYALLLKNHLERLGVVASGVDNWICINQDILNRDERSATEIVAKIRHHQKRMDQIRKIIRTTLDGAVQEMKSEIRADVDRFFDTRSGHVLGNIIEFIRSYRMPHAIYEKNLETAGFSNALFMIFQEFKQALDTYMAETVNPEIIRFVKEEEERIKEHLEAIGGPYDVMVQDALGEYNRTMDHLGIMLCKDKQPEIGLPDMDFIKSVAGIKLPPAVANMRYSAKVKTEAAVRLGFYTGVKFFRKIFSRPLKKKGTEEILALKDGVRRMKRETEKSVMFHFKDYRENIKFQYIFKLMEAMSGNLYELLLDRFQAYVTDLSNSVDLISKKRGDKESASEILKQMERTSREINQRIDLARKKI